MQDWEGQQQGWTRRETTSHVALFAAHQLPPTFCCVSATTFSLCAAHTCVLHRQHTATPISVHTKPQKTKEKSLRGSLQLLAVGVAGDLGRQDLLHTHKAKKATRESPRGAHPVTVRLSHNVADAHTHTHTHTLPNKGSRGSAQAVNQTDSQLVNQGGVTTSHSLPRVLCVHQLRKGKSVKPWREQQPPQHTDHSDRQMVL